MAVAFQSTRPRGARHGVQALFDVQVVVSIHAPTWGATLRSDYGERGRPMFQSTRPRGARRDAVSTTSHPFLFQSTRPRGARPPPTSCETPSRSFQSTRPRGARHRILAPIDEGSVVSIHAPTWGATCRELADPEPVRVSIPAPTWGATARRRRRSGIARSFNPRAHVGRDASHGNRRRTREPGFNPRAHVGRDAVRLDVGGGGRGVSIHAPTWGATSSSANRRSPRSCFNPRAHVGRD